MITNHLFMQAGQIVGVQTPPEWETIATSLKIPFDSTNNFHPGKKLCNTFLFSEYDGYNGETIKQADVVL